MLLTRTNCVIAESWTLRGLMASPARILLRARNSHSPSLVGPGPQSWGLRLPWHGPCRLQQLPTAKATFTGGFRSVSATLQHVEAGGVVATLTRMDSSDLPLFPHCLGKSVLHSKNAADQSRTVQLGEQRNRHVFFPSSLCNWWQNCCRSTSCQALTTARLLDSTEQAIIAIAGLTLCVDSDTSILGSSWLEF